MSLRGYGTGFLQLAIPIMFLFFMTAGVTAEDKGQPGPANEKGAKTRSVTMNFNDVELRVLIKFISELTGKNFLVDPAIKGRVTVLSPQKVTVDEAYKVFLSVLEVNGYTALQAGKVIKIVASGDARAKALETHREMEPLLPEDKIITQLVPLQYADSAVLSKLLRPLIPKTGLLIPYQETNTLIIIDVLSNINRLLNIITELDIPGDKEVINVFVLEYARVEKLAPKLIKIFQRKKGKKSAEQKLKIIPDERTNSIVVLATPLVTSEIMTLIEKLDRKQARPRENIHIYSLQHAVAEDIAKVLLEIPAKAAAAKKGMAPIISKEVQISADKSTNSLVIIAEPDEYGILEEVIRKLDVPRIMVYVEALIIEVSASKALDLGVEWRLGNDYKGGYGAGKEGGAWITGRRGAENRIGDLATGALPAGFAAGVIGQGITLGTVTFATIGAFVEAVRTDSDFNILSTPQILTLDNEEAVIEVGQNLPFVTRVDQGSNEEDRAIQNIEYKDVGVTLKVTPQINKNRFVRLKVEESVKSVLNTTALDDAILAPTTTYRSAKTTITVRDGETAVIGGLIETRINRGKTQTPCLGNIPGLGWLFKGTSDRDEKTNLLVFLTPHIIETPEERKKLHEKKNSEIEKELKRTGDEDQPEIIRKMGYK